jgi:DHA1 family bicyclomycin/chloramphenicol resistance-like MFS transporter
MPDSWTSDGHTSAPARRRTGVPTILIGALTFLTPFSIDVSLAGLPTIARAIGAPGGLMQWTLAAFIFATGAGQLFWGPLSDRFGRRPIVIAGLALFTLSAFACSVANDVALLIALRFTQGLGASAGTVTAFAVITDLALPPDERTRRQALISSISNVGPLAAPIAGVWILSALGWRALYAVPALLGAAMLAAIVIVLPETAQKSVGTPLERYRRAFALPRIAWLAAAIFALFAGYFAMISGSSFVLVAQLGVATPFFAAAFATEASAGLLGSFLASRLAHRIDAERLLAGALAIAVVAAAANAVTGVAFPSAPAFVATMSVYAFAFGIALPAAFSIALAEAGPDAGVASGILGASISLGGAAGSAVDGILPFVASASTGAVVVVAAGASVIAYRRSLRER